MAKINKIKMIEIHEVLDKEFYFTLDLNPITKEYDPHIWIRHSTLPEEAIITYFNASETYFNKQFYRFQLFSSVENKSLYYFNLDKNENLIYVISAFGGHWRY